MKKLLIKIDSLETVNAICAVCMKYRGEFEVDIYCGRYCVDGISVIGVTSMLGREVNVVPITDDDNLIGIFINDMKEIGAYEREEEV